MTILHKPSMSTTDLEAMVREQVKKKWPVCIFLMNVDDAKKAVASSEYPPMTLAGLGVEKPHIALLVAMNALYHAASTPDMPEWALVKLRMCMAIMDLREGERVSPN